MNEFQPLTCCHWVTITLNSRTLVATLYVHLTAPCVDSTYGSWRAAGRPGPSDALFYRPASPHYSAGQRNGWFLSRAYWKDKGGLSALTGGHLCAHKMTNSCLKLVQETGTVTCTVCALLSPLPGDDPVGFLMNKDSFLCKPPEDVSRSAIQSCERTMVTGYNTWTDKHLRPLWFLY